MGVFDTSKTKKHVDNNTVLLSGNESERMQYYKVVMLDAINSGTKDTGDYLVENLGNKGPHKSIQRLYNHSINPESDFHKLIGPVSAMTSKWNLLPGYSIQQVVEEIIGSPIYDVPLFQIQELGSEWYLWQKLCEDFPEHFVRGAYKYEVTSNLLLTTFSVDIYDDLSWGELEPGEDDAGYTFTTHTYTTGTVALIDLRYKIGIYYLTEGPTSSSTTIVEDSPYLLVEPSEIADSVVINNTVNPTSVDTRTNTKVFSRLDPLDDWNQDSDDISVTGSQMISIGVKSLESDVTGGLDSREGYAQDIGYSYSSSWGTPTVTEWSEVHYTDPLNPSTAYTIYYREEVYPEILTLTYSNYIEKTTWETAMIQVPHILILDDDQRAAYFSRDTGSYHMPPIIPIRFGRKWIVEEYLPTSPLYTALNKATKMTLGKSMEKLYDELVDTEADPTEAGEEEPDEPFDMEKIPHIHLQFALPINVKDPKAYRYMFEFFKKYSLTGSQATLLTTSLNNYRTENESFREMVPFLVPLGRLGVKDSRPGGATYNPMSKLPIPKTPNIDMYLMSMHLEHTNPMFSYDRDFKWVSLYEEHNGVPSDLNVNQTKFEVLPKGSAITKYEIFIAGGKIIVKENRPYGLAIKLTFRNSDTTYQTVTVHGFKVTIVEEWDKKTETDTEDVFGDDPMEEGNTALALPIDMTIFSTLSAPIKAQVAICSMQLTQCIAYKYKVKTSWGRVVSKVEKGFKKAVHIMEKRPWLLFTGVGIGTYYVAVGFTNAFMELFAHALVEFTKFGGKLTGLGRESFARLVNAVMAIWAIITAVPTGGQSINWWLVSSKAILAVASEASSQMLEHKMRKIQKQQMAFQEEYKSVTKELDELEKSLQALMSGYDLTKFFEVDSSWNNTGTPIMELFPSSDQFLSTIDSGMENRLDMDLFLTFQYIELTKMIFRNKETNLVDHFNTAT